MTLASCKSFLVALERGGFEPRPALTLRRTVLDTFDGRLRAAGLRLELREASGRELLLTGDGPPAHIAVTRAPRRSSELPAGPMRSRLAPLLEVRALLPLLTVESHQWEAVQRDRLGKVGASVTVNDHLTLATGTDWVAEVDELAGYAKAAQQARTLLESLGLRELDDDLVILAAAAAGTYLCGHSASPTVALDRTEAASDAFRRVLANLAGEVDANWGGTVNDVEPESCTTCGWPFAAADRCSLKPSGSFRPDRATATGRSSAGSARAPDRLATSMCTSSNGTATWPRWVRR